MEVHGLETDVLRDVCGTLGRVSEVGRAFGVFKLARGEVDLDVSLPRRDSNAGPGHRGIEVRGDPHMGTTEAARRRDLTVNAVFVDPLTGDVVDPFGGLADLHARRLRAVDAHTFLDDPLRALRVVQFAGRLGFSVDPSLVDLCRRAPLDELPSERVEAEWRKLLVKASTPSRGFEVARQAGVLARVFPDVVDRRPDAALDCLAALGLAPRGRLYAASLAAWLHDHPAEVLEAVLDQLRLHTLDGYDVRRTVHELVAHLDDPSGTDAELRWLSTRVEVELVLHLREAVRGVSTHDARERARLLGVHRRPPTPWLKGRDLLGLGLAAGPHVGEVLRLLYAEQLDGALQTRDAALARARQLVSSG